MEPLTTTNLIALAAFAISVLSLTISVLNYRRDRACLKLTARLFLSWSPQAPGYIEVKAVNSGRRPVSLVKLQGIMDDGTRSDQYLNHKDSGIRLGENKSKTIRLTHLPRGADEYSPDGLKSEDDSDDYKDISIEDSLGTYHKVPNIRHLLEELSNNYREWCKRTGYWETPAPSARAGDPSTKA